MFRNVAILLLVSSFALAQASAPKNVASAGRTSRKPNRTMMIDTSAATAENNASRRAQVARLETGSD